MKEEASTEMWEHSDVFEASHAGDSREQGVRNHEVVVNLVEASRVARGNDRTMNHLQPATIGDGAWLHVPVSSDDPRTLERGNVLGKLLEYRNIGAS